MFKGIRVLLWKRLISHIQVFCCSKRSLGEQKGSRHSQEYHPYIAAQIMITLDSRDFNHCHSQSHRCPDQRCDGPSISQGCASIYVVSGIDPNKAAGIVFPHQNLITWAALFFKSFPGKLTYTSAMCVSCATRITFLPPERISPAIPPSCGLQPTSSTTPSPISIH